MKTYLTLSILLISLIFTGITNAAWVPPAQNPPNGNTDTPINVGNTAQLKTGGLTVATGGGISKGFVVANGNVGIGVGTTGSLNEKLEVAGRVKATGFCINASCITSWSGPGGPGGGSGGVTRIIPGTNISISPSSGTGNVTINATSSGSGGTYTAGNGLTLSGNQFSVTNLSACGNGQYSRWNGSSWGCYTDQTGSGGSPGGGGGGVSGSGSSNWIPRWSGSTSLSNSIMLQVGSGIRLNNGSSDDKWIGTGGGGGGLRFATDNYWRMTIEQGGDVGINRGLSVGSNLFVGGNIYVNASRYLNGRVNAIGQQNQTAVYGSSFGSSGWGIRCEAFSGAKCGGNIPWSPASDLRLKDNIITIDNALSKTLSLRGVSYNLKSDPNKSRIGFIAQEVEPIVPELVDKGEDGIYSMEVSQVTALLVEAIKEQQKIIENQTVKIKLLEDRFSALDLR